MNTKQIFCAFIAIAQLVTIAESAQAEAAATEASQNMALGCTADLSNYYFNLRGLTR